MKGPDETPASVSSHRTDSSSDLSNIAAALPSDLEALDMSMQMNILAQKYLDPRHSSKRADIAGNAAVSMYGMETSDLTLATREYMEKFGLLPTARVASPPVGELSGCPVNTLIKSDKLMRVPDSLVVDDEDSDALSEVSNNSEVSNDTNFCLPNTESEEDQEEEMALCGANSDSCVHVLAGYQRQPPLPVPSSLLQSASGVFTSPKRRRRPKALVRPGENHISRSNAQNIRVLDLEKIRQTPKLL